MLIEDFHCSKEVSDDAAMLRALSVRYGTSSVNEFWIRHERDQYPILSVAARGDLAVLHYIPKPRSAGFQSVGSEVGLLPEGTTTFCVGSESAEHAVLNEAVISFRLAIIAVTEFARSGDLPESVRWREL